MKCLFSDSLSPEYNRALEEYLYKCSDENILLFYICKPSVVIGAYQNVFGEVNLSYCRKRNIKILRRITGGGTVYHDTGNINYAFIENRNMMGADYKLFIDRITSSLGILSVPAYMDKICDISLNGYKISGSAQKISRGRVLHHGTLLYDADLSELAGCIKVFGDFRSASIKSNPRSVGNIAELCGIKDSTKEFARKLFDTLGKGYEELDLPVCSELKEFEKKYSDPDYLYKNNPAFEFSDGRISFTSKCGIILQNNFNDKYNGTAVDNEIFNRIMYGEI